VPIPDSCAAAKLSKEGIRFWQALRLSSDTEQHYSHDRELMGSRVHVYLSGISSSTFFGSEPDPNDKHPEDDVQQNRGPQKDADQTTTSTDIEKVNCHEQVVGQ